MRIKDMLWVMSKNPLQLEEPERKPNWLTTNMIVAYALPVVEEVTPLHIGKLKSVQSP